MHQAAYSVCHSRKRSTFLRGLTALIPNLPRKVAPLLLNWQQEGEPVQTTSRCYLQPFLNQQTIRAPTQEGRHRKAFARNGSPGSGVARKECLPEVAALNALCEVADPSPDLPVF